MNLKNHIKKYVITVLLLSITGLVQAEPASIEILHNFSGLDGIKVGVDETAIRQNDNRGNNMMGQPILVDGWFYGLGINEYATIDKEQSQFYLYRVAADTGDFQLLRQFPDQGNPAYSFSSEDLSEVPGLTLGSDGYLYGIAPANAPNYYALEPGTVIDTHGGYLYRFLPGANPVIEKLYEFPLKSWYVVKPYTDREVYVTSYRYPEGVFDSGLTEGPDGFLYGVLNVSPFMTGEGIEDSVTSNPEREAYRSPRIPALYRFKPGQGLEIIHQFADRGIFGGVFPERSPLIYVPQENRLYGVMREAGGSNYIYEINGDGSGFREILRLEPESQRWYSDEWVEIYASQGHVQQSHYDTANAIGSLVWSPSRQAIVGYSVMEWYEYSLPANGAGLSSTLRSHITFFSVAPESADYAVLSQLQRTPPTNYWRPRGDLVETADGMLYGALRFGGSRLIDEQSIPQAALTPKNIHGPQISITAGSGAIFRITPDNRLEEQHRFGVMEPVPITQLDERTVYVWRNADGMFPRGITQASDGQLYGINEFGSPRLNGNLFRFIPGDPPEVTPSLNMTWVRHDASDVNPVDQLVAGQKVTLSWQAEAGGMGASSIGNCFASGDWSGAREAVGSELIAPPETPGSYHYTLNCDGPDGRLSDTKTLTVHTSAPETVRATGGGSLTWHGVLMLMALLAIRCFQQGYPTRVALYPTKPLTEDSEHANT